MDINVIPPQAPEMEAALLGVLMQYPRVFDEISDIVRPEMFYNQKHKGICDAIYTLHSEGSPVDMLTVLQRVKQQQRKDISPVDLSTLCTAVGGAHNAETWARVIAQKHIGRRLIEVSGEIMQKAYGEGDILELLQQAEQDILGISNINISRPVRDTAKLANEVLADIQARCRQEAGTTIHTGIFNLDQYTGGLESDLIILAARPGMGKTALVLSIAYNLSIDGKHPVGFFSLEMSANQLIKRLVCQETCIDSDSLKRGHLTDAEQLKVQWATAKIAQSTLHIDDTPGLSCTDFRAKARRMKAEHAVEVIIVDYLQLMTGGNRANNREQEVAEISRTLKLVSKELNLPVIALAQMNRQIEARGTKRPTLSDLRESGAIEQDADIVLFINRPEMYGINSDDGGNALNKGFTELIFAKYRSGGVGNVMLKFNEQIMRFE